MKSKLFRSGIVGLGVAAFALSAPASAETAPSTTPQSDFESVLQQAETADNMALVSNQPSLAPQRYLASSQISSAFREAVQQRSASLEERRSDLETDGLIFVDTSATITVRSSQISNGMAVVKFDQRDTYRTQETLSSKSDLTATEETTGRVATFSLNDGKWVLQSVDLEDTSTFATPLNRPLAKEYHRGSDPLANSTFAAPDAPGKIVGVTTDKGVSREAVINYALKYATNRNSDYRSFGSDCTNFVSQALYAGGWKMQVGGEQDATKWFYSHKGIDTWTLTWSVADNFYYYGRWHANRFSNIGKDVVWMGDVVSVDFQPTGQKSDKIDHTMIATGRIKNKGGWNSLLFTYHSNDRKNYPATSFAAIAPGARYLPLRVL